MFLINLFVACGIMSFGGIEHNVTCTVKFTVCGLNGSVNMDML